MQNISDIDSILNAVNEINLKKKKRNANVDTRKNFIPNINKNLPISPDIDLLIQEAEDYKKKINFKLSQVDLSPNKKDIINSKNYNKTFEEVQSQIIDDLYSKFSKKVKKNTLKIIFNLQLRIKDLEKQLENYQIKKEQLLNEDIIILKDEVEVSSKKPDTSITKLKKLFSKNENLNHEMVTYVKIQDDSISILNNKILNFKNAEEKLRFQITDLEQEKNILLSKVLEFEKTKDQINIINDTKETFKSIYRQVIKQKKLYLDLKNYSIKIERDFNFYKENYENKIIENNDIKKKLSNTIQQVEAFEEIKKELVFTFENFNNVLSKNSIVKLNESFSKIKLNPVSSADFKKKNK